MPNKEPEERFELAIDVKRHVSKNNLQTSIYNTVGLQAFCEETFLTKKEEGDKLITCCNSIIEQKYEIAKEIAEMLRITSKGEGINEKIVELQSLAALDVNGNFLDDDEAQKLAREILNEPNFFKDLNVY